MTAVPTGPLVGVKLLTTGAGGRTSKFVELASVPPGVVTLIVPSVAPAGTVVVMVVALFVRMEAAVPLNETPVAPARLVPLIVTAVPTGPLVGVKLLTTG